MCYRNNFYMVQYPDARIVITKVKASFQRVNWDPPIFDKEYNELNSQLYFRATHLQELLNMGRSQVPVEIRTLMMIDSLEMIDHDRELIVYHSNNCKENQIVITHGRD